MTQESEADACEAKDGPGMLMFDKAGIAYVMLWLGTETSSFGYLQLDFQKQIFKMGFHRA